MRGKY